MIVVEYHFIDKIPSAPSSTFILPMETIFEAELYIMSKCYKDGTRGYVLHLDDYQRSKNKKEISFLQRKEFTLDNFKFSYDMFKFYVECKCKCKR